MRTRTMLLAGTHMTAVERAQGRFMRAPDHPKVEDAPAATDPVPATDPNPDPQPTPAPAADPAADPASETTDAFADAFKAASEETSTTPVPPVDKPAPKADPTPTPEPAADPTPTPTPDPTPTPSDDLMAKLAAVLGDRQAPAAAAPTPTEPEQTPIYDAAETTLISEYQNNWPDVAKAENLLRRAEYHDLLKYVFSEVARVTNPMSDQLRTMGNNLHMGEVKAAVPDYTENLETDVATWIGTQPAYLQPAYKHVMENGTSDEVVDLIGRYRSQTGTTPASATPAPAGKGPAPEVAKKVPKTELSQAAKQAAESLAPVGGDRTQSVEGDDPQDFPSAFAKYAATM